jgi:hypothetical protein
MIQPRLVQCKRWTSWSVDLEEIRKLGGTLLAEGLPGTAGVLVTSSDFTQAATETAKQLRLEIIDGAQLVHRLEAAGATGLLGPLRRSQSRWLCPHFAAPMVLDQSSHGWWLRRPAYRTGCKGKRDLGADPQHALELLRATT